jgi:hypothetical protein
MISDKKTRQTQRQSLAMQALDQLHQESKRRGINRTTLPEIQKEIRAVRKQRTITTKE